MIDAPRSTIRYLEPFFLTNLPAFAIRCRVLVGRGDQAAENITWTPEETARFKKMIMDRTLVVRFENQTDVLVGKRAHNLIFTHILF